MEFRVGDDIVGCVELNGYAGEGIFDKLYKSYNDALNNDSTAYNEKCKIVAEIWKNIAENYVRHKIQDVVHVMEWGKHHTFDVILDGQWNHHKECFEDVILIHLKECEQGLVKVHKQFHFHFQGLIKVIQQPWDNEILRGILQNSEKTELTQQEIAYFANESGYATSMRIKKLVDAQCEDFAINLCSSYLKCLKLFEEGKVTLAVTEDQKKYAFDIYVALLYRVKRMDTMVGLLKALSDKEAKELVGRFSSKNAVNCKVWKSSYKVTFFSAMVFLHRHAQLKNPEDEQTVLHILESWLKMMDGNSLMGALTAIKSLLLNQDATSNFIYTIIEGLKSCSELLVQQVKQTRIELYIRALTKDLNRLEALRYEPDKGMAAITSKELAAGLLKLADELHDHLNVSRECVLTAFSLDPTKVIFDQIEILAARSGLNAIDTKQWECKFHAPVQPSEVTVECSNCNEHMQVINLQAFNTNTILSEALTGENLGLPQELCDDLSIILCSPRYNLLSWLQEWNDLHRLCLMYLDNPDKTKNYITDLKFLEIDFAKFQKGKKPSTEEQSLGYDKVLEESDASNSCEEDLQIQFRRKRRPKKQVIRDSSEDEEEQKGTEDLNAMESDPKELESLRTFRKRKSDDICSSNLSIEMSNTEVEDDTTVIREILEWNVKTYKQFREENVMFPSFEPHFEEDVDMEILDLTTKRIPASEKVIRLDANTMLHSPLSMSDSVPEIIAEDHPTEKVDTFRTVQRKVKETEPNVKIISSQILPPIPIGKISWRDAIINIPPSQVIIQRLENNKLSLSSVPQRSIRDPDAVPSTSPDLLTTESSLTTSTILTTAKLNTIKPKRSEIECFETNNKKAISQTLIPVLDATDIAKSPMETITESVPQSLVSSTAEMQLSISAEPITSAMAEQIMTTSAEITISQIGEPIMIDPEMVVTVVDPHAEIISEPVIEMVLEPLVEEVADIFVDTSREPIVEVVIKELMSRNIKSAIEIPLEPKVEKITEIIADTAVETVINTTETLIDSVDIVALTTLEPNIDMPRKSILEDVTQITKDNIDVTTIEEVIGQKITKKQKLSYPRNKPRHDSYLERLLSQPRFKRSHKPTKFDDYLYDFTEYRRKKQSKQVDTNKNEIVQNISNEHDEEKRNETSSNVLKSDNYHSGQKYVLHQDGDGREQTNHEKSLFREKGTEGFYTEETGKINKKPYRESNENKENSGFISKRAVKGKIKKKPKKHRRLSKSDDKEVESDLETERIRISTDVFVQLLRDVKVVIDRISLPERKRRFTLSNNPDIFEMCEQLNKKLPRRPFSDNNQRVLENWRCRNPEYNDVILNPKVMVKRIPFHKKNKVPTKKIPCTDTQKNTTTDCNIEGPEKHSNCDKKPNHNQRSKIRNTNKTNKDNAKNVLANVPGMKDTELIQPVPVENVVQVVQMPGRSSSSSTTTQTSTQVTPHIQRIGQPRQDKPETSDATATTSKTTTNAKPASTQSSLINILSHPVIRTSTGTTTTNWNPPVINILSNQIIRPATNPRTVNPTRTTTTATTTMLSQSNNNANRSSGESQLINQLTNPSRASTTAAGASTIKVATSSEPSRIVQFICQSSDGKLIPVSSFAQNCVVKVASSQNISPTSPNYEENFPKVVKSKLSESAADSESSDTLPKFQQAFGKSVYQTKPTSTNSTNVTNNAINHEVDKPKITVVQKSIVTTTTTTTSVKPIPGGVIYTRQVQSGQTINLIPQSRGQVFRIATSNSDQISVVKDTLIQNKMNALLAAALSKKDVDDSESEKLEETSSSSTTTTTRVAIARPGLVQNARIVKPVLQIPSNVIRNTPQNMSSTTLEQLREFDMVYKQVKERSSTTPASEASTNSETSESQCISVTYLNQGQKINCAPIVVVSSYNTIQPVSSPALNVVSQGNTSPRVTPSPSQTSTIPKVTPKASKGKTVKTTAMQNTSKASPIPKPQQKPQEDEHTTQRIFDILAEYAEQLRNSPDLNNKPAPRRRSNPPTNPSQNSKRKKSSSSKKPSQSNSTLPAEPDTEDPRTLGSEDSSCGVMQLSVPDDEQPTTLASTSESNDSTSTPRQQLILTDSSNQPRNLIIAESSVGEALKMPNTAVLVPGNYIMPVSMVKGGQQIAVVSGGSKILATVPARSGPNMLLFQSFLNQNRKTSVPTVKYSTIQPISGISSQSLAGVTAQPPVILPPLSHSISTVTLGQPITVKKLDNSGQVNTELLLTISQSRETDSSEDTPQPDSSTNVMPANIETVEIEEATTLSDNSSEKSYTPYQKPLITTPIATPVIAQTSTANTIATPPKEEVLSEQSQSTTQTVMTLNIAPIEQKGEQRKTEERIQTVLVTASSSNGSMITQTRTSFKDSTRVINASQQNKDDFLRNNDKRNSESKNIQSNNTYQQQGKIKKVQVSTQRLDRDLQQLCLQRKQAALERELRLQKSLSEECEDLGVDEPSTSDLFPEAELLFDSNHSPSFEQTTDVTKRVIVQQEGGKEEAKLTLFGDDDFLFEAGEYHKGESTAEYDGRTNGQSTEDGSPCEDATLLRTCTSMSDVTLNSPISPDTFHPTTPPPLHKYVHKYSNRKRSDKTTKQVDNWTGEVSSSEDTTGSNEIKSSSPEICLSKVTEEELADGNFKVVRVAIAKRECGDCSEEGDCSLSGRGARRSVKKLCSCCNGASSQDSRKRPAQPHQHVPVPQKKVFPVKKR